MTHPLLRALFLDLDQTLADDRSSADQSWEDAYRFLLQFDNRLPHDDFKEIYWRMSNDVWSVLDEETPPEATAEAVRLEIWPEALRRVGCADWKELGLLGAQRYWERRLETYHLYPDTISFLDSVRERVPVVLVTNGTRDIQEAKIEKTGLRDHLDDVLVAQAAGASKPSPRIFEKALRLVDCHPGEALMVGDNYDKDIIGALRCGIRAIWIRREGNGVEPPYAPFPEAVIHELAPVLDLASAAVS